MAGHIAAAAVALLAMGAYYYSSPSQPSTGVTWCQRGDPCWPTSDEIEAFARAMRSDEPRKLEYFPGHPFPPGIPLDLPHSDHSQPLFGLGARSNVIEGMYYVRDPDEGKKCYSFAGDYFSATCNASARNSPFERWHPAFITFPVNEEQIQASLEFAVKHNLCIMVAGTGHEYNNRHSCPTDGMLIRTTQLRRKEYLPKWEINPAFAPHGALRVGPGSTFLEIHEFAQNNRFLIASGWCMSVGIMGWSLGGGHSYMGPHAGLGSQNLLEVTIFQVDISPKGQPIVVRRVVNEQSNADLFFALRGGGGSTWGVISSLTVRVHALPSDGSDEHGYITMVNISRQGHFCDKATFGKYDKDYLHGIIDKHERWTLKLTQKFSQSWIYNTINTSDKGSPSFIIPGAFPKCKQQWTVSAFWFFVGPKNDPEHLARFKEALEALDWTEGDVPGNKLIMFEGYKGLFDYSKSLFDGQMFGYPASYSGPASAENVQSQQTVLVPRNVVESGVWKANFKKLLELCWNAPVGKENCPFHYIYSLKSHIGSPVINGTALSKGMTEGLIHHDTTAIGYFGSSFSQKQMEQFYYNLGDYSYFSESAYYLPGWQKRYWGDNYDALLSIKNKYDPLRKFWCHHCVGDWMFPDS